MPRRLIQQLGVIALAALALVLAHQMVFLVRYGSIYGEALAHAGHGQAWSDAVTTVIGAAIVLAAGSVVGLWRLSRQLRGRPIVRASAAMDGAAVARRWLRASAWLTLAVLVVLTVQENVEHAAAGLGLPGPEILVTPEYPFAVAIVAGVSLVVALVATILTWRRETLLARIAALRAGLQPHPRPPHHRTGSAAFDRGLTRRARSRARLLLASLRRRAGTQWRFRCTRSMSPCLEPARPFAWRSH
jgi:hypothetical protein